MKNRFGMLDGLGDTTNIWRYGWRYVPDPAKPGDWIKQPLTWEDILRPLEDDFWPSAELHTRDVRYLQEVAESQLKDDLTALVLSDQRIAWDEPGDFAHRPDLAVFRGVRKPRQSWSTFNVAHEKCRPLLILEVTLPGTRLIDIVNKVEEFEDEGVEMYVIADGGRTPARECPMLTVYRHNGEQFIRTPLDTDGRVWLEVLGVFLGWEGDRLACYLPDGQRIPEAEPRKRPKMNLVERIEAAEKKVEEAREEVKKEQRLRQAADEKVTAAKRQAIHAQTRAVEAHDEATLLARRVRELEALLNPRPPQQAGGSEGSLTA